jgi:hypothetical protein
MAHAVLDETVVSREETPKDAMARSSRSLRAAPPCRSHLDFEGARRFAWAAAAHVRSRAGRGEAARWYALLDEHGAAGGQYRFAWDVDHLLFQFVCEDERLDAIERPENGPVWLDDSIELFLCPTPALPIYVQIACNALGNKAVLLTANREGETWGWAPWWHDARPQVEVRVFAQGGEKRPGARISGWAASIRVPTTVFCGLADTALGPHATLHFHAVRNDGKADQRRMWAAVPALLSRKHDYADFPALRLR